jgi:hypothetical protein
MHELDPETRALIDLARAGDDPTVSDRRRVLRGLSVSLSAAAAVTAAAGSASAAGSATAVATSASGSVAAWLATGALVGLVASTTVVALTGPSSEAPGASSASPPGDPPAARPVRLESPEGVTAQGTTAAQPEPQPDPQPRRSPLPAAVPTAAPDLAAETALLREAQSALGRGDPLAALGALDAHAARFPAGVLTEERLGARALALCNLGRRAEGAQAASALLERSPTSPLRARIVEACLREPGPGRLP